MDWKRDNYYTARAVEDALKVLEINADAARDSGLEYTGSTTREARATLAAHIAAQDAEIARLREALRACIDYGSMTDDGWVTDKARAALEAK